MYRLKNEAGCDIYFNKGNSPSPFRDRDNFLTARLIACSQEAKALQSEPGFLEWVESELEYHCGSRVQRWPSRADACPIA